MFNKKLLSYLISIAVSIVMYSFKKEDGYNIASIILYGLLILYTIIIRSISKENTAAMFDFFKIRSFEPNDSIPYAIILFIIIPVYIIYNNFFLDTHTPKDPPP